MRLRRGDLSGRTGDPSGRTIDPLLVLGAVLLVVALALTAVAGRGESEGSGRSGSVYDGGDGGAQALRLYFEAMGARTTTIQGDRFDPADAAVVFILAPSEFVSAADAQALRAYVRDGGTAVLAGEVEIFSQPILDAFGLRYAGIAVPGEQRLRGALFAAPSATRITFDFGRSLTLSGRWDPLATDGRGVTAAVTPEGKGALIVVGSVAPFIAGHLGEADNGRFALALAANAFGGKAIAFDEYHHGVHPAPDMLAVIERTWPGRALLFLGLVVFLYLLLGGRRLGPPLPLDARPPRSSLEYVRGFAGLVRRSGHGEIARRRLRRDLHAGLARATGLDPSAPFERVVAAFEVSDPARAAEARELDHALDGRLREAELVRSVARIERVTRLE